MPDSLPAVPLKTMKSDESETKPEEQHFVYNINRKKGCGKPRCSQRCCYIFMAVVTNLCILAGIGYGIYKAVNRANEPPFIVYKKIARSCDDLYQSGIGTDGVYNITVGFRRMQVYCEFQKEGFNWLVFQRRVTGQQNFNLDWTSYVDGFGDLNGDFWLGLYNIRHIAQSKLYKLRVEVKDWHDQAYFTEYRTFSLDYDMYRLQVGDVVDKGGNFGYAFTENDNQQFSTFDIDNDATYSHNCAELHQGGWWFSDCGPTNLNGKRTEKPKSSRQGILWTEDYTNITSNMKEAAMKMRPLLGTL